MLPRLACLLLLALAPLAAPAVAQSADPVAVVRSIYGPNGTKTDGRMSRRLEKLRRAAEANSRKLEQPVSGLDFDFGVNGQDNEDDYLKTLKLVETKREAKTAEVRATFRNGGPQTLLYSLVLEGPAWKIDDVRLVAANGWTLSKLYIAGAKEK